ncbi:RteC domain-containing protein [Bacteroides sp. 519]|uniref:RteC domain-containing protein n=1 Tax=Bacteroides sp. 519 TaxID=2302937 RepID=UPI0013D1E15A|nr:RteC domain-containing protein [Bacteroides sp. 519]NDV56705.1 RteC protein [Bacteroides sp. 519]
MIQFTSRLKKEIDAKIEIIESSEISMITKSLEASRVFVEAYNQLKTFVLSYTFQSEEEEILFFKEIKPRLCFRLIYYRKLYNIEMDRPTGIEKQREYLNDLLNSINRYNGKRLDFIRYYRSGSSCFDSLYFLRGQADTEQYMETFSHEFDPKFSTNCDFKVAKILANDMLSDYLTREIEALSENNNLIMGSFGFPATKITWKGTKAEFQEQILSWDSAATFGDVPQTQLHSYMQNVFNIQVDSNLSRVTDDLKTRNTPTPYIDKLKAALLRRMGRK